MIRPRRTRLDSNRPVLRFLHDHDPVVDVNRLRYIIEYNGRLLVFLKIADLPGQTDWLIFTNCDFLIIEEKQLGKENDFTPGEKIWKEVLPDKFVVCIDKEQVESVLKRNFFL